MKPLPALLLLAAGLAGVIAVEVTSGPVVRAPPPVPIRAVALGPHAPAEAPAVWRAILLDRPVFSPDRRPPSVPAAASPGERSLPRLAGVLIGPTQRRAIFAGGAVLAVGDALGPWRIGEIEEGSVTVLGPQGVQVLRPAYAAGGAHNTERLTEAQAAAPPPAHPAPPPVTLSRLRRPK